MGYDSRGHCAGAVADCTTGDGRECHGCRGDVTAVDSAAKNLSRRSGLILGSSI